MLCRNCGRSEFDHGNAITGRACPVGGTMFMGGGAANVNYTSAKPLLFEGNSLAHIEFWKPPVNPKFHAALKKMAEVHDKKSADYADTKAGKYYSNFEEAAATAGVSVDDVFGVQIGIKLARLRELLKSGKIPNNESIQDTRLDLAVYSVLWLSYFEPSV